MGADPKAVDSALAAVHRTLDRLTQRGEHGPAFEIARAQFSASVRASWPANLTGLAHAIDRALDDPEIALDPDERRELVAASAILRAISHD